MDEHTKTHEDPGLTPPLAQIPKSQLVNEWISSRKESAAAVGERLVSIELRNLDTTPPEVAEDNFQLPEGARVVDADGAGVDVESIDPNITYFIILDRPRTLLEQLETLKVQLYARVEKKNRLFLTRDDVKVILKQAYPHGVIVDTLLIQISPSVVLFFSDVLQRGDIEEIKQVISDVEEYFCCIKNPICWAPHLIEG